MFLDKHYNEHDTTLFLSDFNESEVNLLLKHV